MQIENNCRQEKNIGVKSLKKSNHFFRQDGDEGTDNSNDYVV